MNKYKRPLDIIAALVLLTLLSLPMIFISILVKLTSKGPVLYWSSRVGRYSSTFKMPKFRTMYLDTPEVATHLLNNPVLHLTPIGSFMRKTSLDELPQLICILRGEMSLVGPRPALHNQTDLVELRRGLQIDTLAPGITGWAQVNGRDKLTLTKKVEYDYQYLKNQSFLFDTKVLLITLKKIIFNNDVAH